MQQLGSDSVIIKWRGNVDEGAEADNLCFGTDMASLPAESKTDAAVTATGHSEVQLSGLQADTTYYYSIGGAGVAEEAHHFRTAPAVGQLPPDGNTRIWIVGDSGVGGTGAPEAGYVRDGFATWVKNNGDETAQIALYQNDGDIIDFQQLNIDSPSVYYLPANTQPGFYILHIQEGAYNWTKTIMVYKM